MDKVKLNNSPGLTMEQITKQLFNNEELSDIKFIVEGKTLFGHSWELMKRSIVFYEQFKGTLGESKIMVIQDAKYIVFREFLRFIYTDEYTIDEDMICEMLRLAVKYKIPKLETELLGLRRSVKTRLKLIEFFEVNKYEMGRSDFFEGLFGCQKRITDFEIYFGFSADIWRGILMCNFMPRDVTEMKLFQALMYWINHQCEEANIPLVQQRSIYDNLLKLIRFPVMTGCEFECCVEHFPHLFTNDDVNTIRKIIAGRLRCVIAKWICVPRFEYIPPYKIQQNAVYQTWTTTFKVSKHLILYGVKYGTGFGNFQLTISRKNEASNATTVLQIEVKNSGTLYNIISLGESINLIPHWDYTIETKDLSASTTMVLRKPTVNVRVSGPNNFITFKQRSLNLFEIFFKFPTNEDCAGQDCSTISTGLNYPICA